jgi:hypothetical protein
MNDNNKIVNIIELNVKVARLSPSQLMDIVMASKQAQDMDINAVYDLCLNALEYQQQVKNALM